MKKRAFLLIALSVCLMGSMIFASCKDGKSSPVGPGSVLLETDVNVPGGGNSTVVTFSANSGLTIRITLTASNTTMEPYGYLTFANGQEGYYPDLSTAQNGMNSVDKAIPQSGTHQLSVMDGTNQGGMVHVKVEVL